MINSADFRIFLHKEIYTNIESITKLQDIIIKECNDNNIEAKIIPSTGNATFTVNLNTSDNSIVYNMLNNCFFLFLREIKDNIRIIDLDEYILMYYDIINNQNRYTNELFNITTIYNKTNDTIDAIILL